MRLLLFFVALLVYAFHSKAQQEKCTLKSPQVTIHFGAGNVSEQNTMVSARYDRVSHYCPSDGYYAFTPSTSNCFKNDWFTITQDHTAGDVNGNMLLINSSPGSGMFFRTSIGGLKAGAKYEFGVWLMNVCKITEKCPFPLLPEITIGLRTTDGKNIAQLETGKVPRLQSPRWTQYSFMFTAPHSGGSIDLIMINNAPGGCGNDFALDDITFRECVIVPPVRVAAKKSPEVKKTAVAKTVVKKTAVKKTVVKKAPPAAQPRVSRTETVRVPKLKIDSQQYSLPPVKPRVRAFPPPPAVLTRRTNVLVKQITMEAGKIKIALYDNGEIDNDTVSIYHNNRLLAAHVRLSQNPMAFYITIDPSNPHHELVMVAENLGSIPPNTSLMIVTAGEKREEVFISSTKQKNAKVIFDLKQ